jgi:hypothetical protein
MRKRGVAGVSDLYRTFHAIACLCDDLVVCISAINVLVRIELFRIFLALNLDIIPVLKALGI